MLKTYEMSRVVIAGHKNAQESVIKELHELKVLHVVEHLKNDQADIGLPLASSNRLSELIVKIRAIIHALGIKKKEGLFDAKANLLDIGRTAKKLAEEVNRSNEELRRIDELLARNILILNELQMLKNIDIPIGAFGPYKTLDVITGIADMEYEVNFLRDSLSAKTGNFMLRSGNFGKKVFIALFIDKAKRDYADGILQKINFAPVNLAGINTNGLDKSRNAAECIKSAEAQRHRLQSLKGSFLIRMKKLANDYKNFLISSEEFLSQELEKTEVPLKFAATKDAFLVKGWVPKEQLAAAVERLEKAGKNKIYIHSEEAGKKDNNVPVKLKNPGYAKPFEFFIDMYSLPKYKEIDPTFFVFLSFPIFFGFMLGDIGYGVVSLILFYLLKKKFPKGKALLNVLILSSIFSTFFGLLFGEFFGLEEIGPFEIPHLISRTHDMFALMYIAIGIGIVHVNWGLVSGFFNVYKAHGLKHAALEKVSWIVLEAGVALLMLSLLKKIYVHWAVGALVLIISIFMLYKGEGVKGLIELPSILTNILSYLRLAAIGLSSVYIAAVVNEMAGGFFHEGGVLIVIGILLLLAGHVLNAVLGLFGSFLHSLRLHYVEFFSKFFEGGAEKYRPFGAKQEQ